MLMVNDESSGSIMCSVKRMIYFFMEFISNRTINNHMHVIFSVVSKIGTCS